MSVRMGTFPPPNAGPMGAPGMPGPMPPMGAAPNPFAPMPPMPLAGMPPPPPPMGGMPPPPMPQAPMPQPSSAGLGSVAGSNAPRRRMFGDYLESTLGGGQSRTAPQMARPPQMQQQMQQRMVAPGTPAMRTPPMQSMMPRPMAMGGIVNVSGLQQAGQPVFHDPNQPLPMGLGQNPAMGGNNSPFQGMAGTGIEGGLAPGLTQYGGYLEQKYGNPQFEQKKDGFLQDVHQKEQQTFSGMGGFSQPEFQREQFQNFMGGGPQPFADGGEVDVFGYDDGGAVPRQTEIRDEPHMLAYINPEEAQLLKDLGGTGEPGPGGIPAYRGRGAADPRGFGDTFTADRGMSDATKAAIDFSSNDDNPNVQTVSPAVADAYKEAAASMLSAGVGSVGGTNYNPTANDDNVISKYTDNETSALDDIADQTYMDSFDLSDGSIKPGSVADNLVGAQNTNLGSLSDYGNNDTLNAVVDYNTNAGNQNTGNTNVTTLTESQLATAGSDNQGATAAEILIDRQNAAAAAAQQAAAQQAAAAAAQAAAEAAAKQQASADWFNSLPTPTTTSDFGGVVSPFGVDSSPISTSDLLTPAFPSTSAYGGADQLPVLDGSSSTVVPASEETDYTKIDSVNPAGTGVGATDDDLATDFSIFDLPTPDDAENPVSLLRPANVGLGRGSGFKSIEQLKAEITAAEGTADDGGYDRLLDKGETGTFAGNKKLSEMTVAEAIEFGTSEEYRNYSRDVLGRGPNELPSTPMGKYQIVGTTLRDLVDRGLVDPNAQFDAQTQEELGSLLVENRGYNDVLTGKITQAEFEKGLGQEFEGIKKDEDFSLSGASVMNASDIEAKVASGGSLTPEEFDFMVNDTSAITSKIEPEFGLTFGDGDDDEDNTGINQPFSSTETASGQSGTDLYLSAVKKNALGEKLSDSEQLALYSARGQTPNAAETSYLEDLLGGAKHTKDGPIDNRRKIADPYDPDGKTIAQGGGIDNPNYNKPMYKAGDSVTPDTFGQKALQAGLGVLDTLYNPLAIFGDKFTLKGNINGVSDKKVSEQLEAYKNGGTFVYGEDGKTVVGVAAPNYDASGDGNNDTVVLYDENDDFKVTGDSTGLSDIVSSNANSDSTIDVVESNKTYTNTEDGVVTGSTTSTDTGTDTGSGDDTTTEVDTGYTTDENGNRICNKEGYVYDVATDACVPAVEKEEEESTNTSVNIGSGASRSFEDVLKNIQTKPTTIAPISANIKPMAQGGMAGLNRTADNFLRALGG